MNISTTWWTYFVLPPEANAQLLDEPAGKVVAKQFRQAFRLSYMSFKVKTFDFAVKTWWPDWEENQVDAFGHPVGYLELKLLGCLNVLGLGSDHLPVSLQTNISKEVPRVFFMKWVGWLTSVKDNKFIYMPHRASSIGLVVTITTLVAEGLRFESRGVLLLYSVTSLVLSE